MRELKFRAWDGKKYIYPELWDNTMPSNWKKYYVLEQYTGLKDKNGVKIYEGDIMGKGPLTCVVEQQEDGAYVLRFVSPVMKGLYISILDPKVANSEITGNIHTNPELLK